MLLLLLLIITVSINKINSKLIKNVSISNSGNLLISHDDEHKEYNNQRLMIVFDLECLNYNETKQKEKILSIIEEKNYPCLIDHEIYIQHNKTNKAYSFLNLNSTNNDSCIHDIYRILNYTQHCIDYVMYEPLFRLSFNHLTSSEYTCITEDVSASSMPIKTQSAWDLDQLDSAKQNDKFIHPSFAFDNGVDLYVVDSGVLASHQEFYPGQVIHKQGDGPTRYVNGTTTWYASHGTHVSGSFGGINYGVTKNLTIYDYRVCEFSSYYAPTSADDYPCPFNLMATAFEKIVKQLSENGRRGVINLSLGASRSSISTIFEYYFELFIENGGIVVVAAGNSNVDACDDAPAYSDTCIAVGAVNSSLQKAYFSNYGNCVDIWAPGVNITSSVANCNTCYAMYDGTSMASPHIAGLIASYLWVNPTLNYSDIRSILQYNTTKVTGSECNNSTCKFPFINHCSYTPIYTELNWTKIDNENSANGFGNYSIFKTTTNFLAVVTVDTITSKPSNMFYTVTDKCITNKQDPADFYSYAYICDTVRNDTVYLYYYPSQTCVGNRTLIQTIKTGGSDGDESYYVQCLNKDVNISSYAGTNADIGIRTRVVNYYINNLNGTQCGFNKSYESYFDEFFIADACYWSINGTENVSISWKFSCTDNSMTRTYYNGLNCQGRNESITVQQKCYTNSSEYVQILQCPGYNVTKQVNIKNHAFMRYNVNYLVLLLLMLISVLITFN